MDTTETKDTAVNDMFTYLQQILKQHNTDT